MRLSKRLETVIAFAALGSRVADVGTDHGFIPIELVRRGTAVWCCAMDVGQGPLMRAAEHIRQQGLEDWIETRLGDGVEKLLPGEADTVIIAGMGGRTVIHILENGSHLWEGTDRWILSPQSEIDKVRRFLYARGFVIVREDMVEDTGKYYTVMEAVYDRERAKAQGEPTAAQYLYGPRLTAERNKVLMEFLACERRKLLAIIEELKQQKGEKARKKRKILEERLRYIEEIGGGLQGEVPKRPAAGLRPETGAQAAAAGKAGGPAMIKDVHVESQAQGDSAGT